MTASIEDTGRAARLRPDDVLRYLAATGWQRTREYGRGEIWELEAGRDHPYEVLVPLDQRLRDYSLRMADLLETISAAEHRDPTSVLGDLDLRWADVLYLRLETLSLEDLAPALTGLRDLELASARAVEPRRARDYVRQTQVGTARTGSALIGVRTALSPEPGEPFERRVTRTLYEGVLAAHRLTSGADFEAHGSHGEPAASAEVCAALARIGGRGRQGYELRFAWSPDVPFKGYRLAVDFTAGMLGEVAKAARDLRR